MDVKVQIKGNLTQKQNQSSETDLKTMFVFLSDTFLNIKKHKS